MRRHMPAPFLSLLIDDCIATGKDYHDGGARYNTSYIQGVGLGTMTDALTAIKYHVFDQRKLVDDGELLDGSGKLILQGHERTRLMLLNRTPRYGNDDDYADDVMVRSALRPTSTRWTAGPTPRAGTIASICCRRPSTSILAR